MSRSSLTLSASERESDMVDDGKDVITGTSPKNSALSGARKCGEDAQIETGKRQEIKNYAARSPLSNSSLSRVYQGELEKEKKKTEREE